MTQPVCPFCLGRHDFKASRECPASQTDPVTGKKESVPMLYIEKYDKVRPVFLVSIGFSRHGKTTYQAALTLMLEKLNKVFKESTYRPLDQFTFNWITKVRTDAIQGGIPEQTKMVVPRPAILHMYQLPKFGSRCLVLYDTPGELFKDLTIGEHTGYLQSLKAVKNLWFIIGLEDLEKHPEQNIHDLLSIYLTGMEQMGWSLKNRNLIVVYTKADTVVDRFDSIIPEDIEKYLKADPFRSLTNPRSTLPAGKAIDLDQYLEDMKDISDKLKELTREKINGGGSFIGLAEDVYELGLYFTITSALGSQPNEQGRMDVEADRYRVLDPFFWALQLNQPEQTNPVSLILDATSSSQNAADGSPGSSQVYQQSLKDLGEVLSDDGEVTAYYMGHNRPASHEGFILPTSPPSSPRPRFIGPIIENAKPDELFIVLTAGPIKDLADFNPLEWQNRILLVSVGKEEVQNWNNQVVLRPGDTMAAVAQAFKRMINSKDK